MSKKEYFQIFLIDPRYRIYRHMVMIAYVFILIIGIVDSIPNNIAGINRVYMGIGYTVIILVAVYLNILWAVKRFLLKNELFKYLLFILITILSVLSLLATLQICFYDIEETIGQLSPKGFVANLLASMVNVGLLLTGISTFILLRYWNISNIKKNELQTTTLQSELDYLKNQINPHFLFNMLNNALVLIKKQRPEASEVLFKLEDLLRYQLDDSSKEWVSLRSDIHFLRDFLNLEKIRRDKFIFVLSGEDVQEDIMIPPLLFIPFVENAVKYSQDSNSSSYVLVSFEIEGEKLIFTCINSKPQGKKRKSASSGLGLTNVKRRLELLYPGKHTLSFIDEAFIYRVKLTIEL